MARNDNRKKVKLANGLTLLLPSYCIHEFSSSVRLDLPDGSKRLYAKWYVTVN